MPGAPWGRARVEFRAGILPLPYRFKSNGAFVRSVDGS